MISPIKICGISDPSTLNYILNHPHPPSLIGFIVNWKASSRYVELNRLKELLNIDKKKENNPRKKKVRVNYYFPIFSNKPTKN